MELGRVKGEMGKIVDKEAALGKIRLTADQRRRVEDLPIRIKKTAFVQHWFAVTQAWQPSGGGIECWPDPRARYGLDNGPLWLEVDQERRGEVQLIEVRIVPANVIVKLIHNDQLFVIHL